MMLLQAGRDRFRYSHMPWRLTMQPPLWFRWFFSSILFGEGKD